MKTLEFEKTKHWPPYEEAVEVVRERGHIRIDADFSAASIEKLDSLYKVIRTAIEDGTYGRSQAENDPVAQRQAFLDANPGTAALAGLAGAGSGDNTVVLQLLEQMKANHEATVSELNSKIASLEERLGESAPAADAKAADAKVDPATGKPVADAPAAATPPAAAK